MVVWVTLPFFIGEYDIGDEILSSYVGIIL